MALRVLRIAPQLARHCTPIAVHSGAYTAQELVAASSASPAHSSYPSQRPSVYLSCDVSNARFFSSSSSSGGEESSNKPSNVDAENDRNDQPELMYEGPFASLTLKLKRISLTSAVIAFVGLPALSVYGGAGVPVTGQLAIIGTAGATAVGSTALLSYCFSPYVHTLERLPASLADSNGDASGEDGAAPAADATTSDDAGSVGKSESFRIITRDILARRVETIFDPATDVTTPSENNRPFCNFMVKGMPMYVHKEMVQDHKLRVQLVGEEDLQKKEELEAMNKKKTDDDEFF